VAQASGRGGAVTAGEPVATALALAEGTALAVAGGTEPGTMLPVATADGVGATGVAAIGVPVGMIGTELTGVAVGADVGAVVAAGAAHATATSPRASNDTNLLCLTAILLYVQGG
jgi:hypothetical protein